MVAFIGVLTLIVTLIIGIPLPFAFACAFMWLTVGYGYTPDFLLAAGYGQLNSVVLLAIPLFRLAGGIMEKEKSAGHSSDSYRFSSGVQNPASEPYP